MDAHLYEQFSEWIATVKDEKLKDYESAKRKAQVNWDTPKDSKETSVLDFDKISDKFKRDELQDAYLAYLKNGDSEPIDALLIKYQNSVIAAHELAFRIRHASTARSFASGLCDGKRWNDKNIPDILRLRVNYLINCYTNSKEQDG